METPSLPKQTVEPTQTPNVSQATGAHFWMVVIGCVLVILFAAGSVANHFGGSETTEVTKPAKEGAADGGEEAKVTEKTSTSTTWPSDTLLTTLLGAGAALIIVGFLYARISSITLPGGAKLDLTPAEKKKAVEATLDKLPPDTPADEAAAKVTKTLSELAQVKAAGVEIPEKKITETAARTVAPLAGG